MGSKSNWRRRMICLLLFRLARLFVECGLDFIFLDTGRGISGFVEILLFGAVTHHPGMIDVFCLGMLRIGLVGHEGSPDTRTRDLTSLSPTGSLLVLTEPAIPAAQRCPSSMSQLKQKGNFRQGNLQQSE